MSKTITLTVNGETKKVEIEGHEFLIDIIRDAFDLTGTKRGCDDFHCGACTVVVDGEAIKSCWLKAEKADGKKIVTIEGLAEGTKLHPIQQSLIDAGAVQCGFCIPGIVMELYALFTKNINATEEEIFNSLGEHLCRCTGYETILKGAKLAQRKMKEK
ncbi:TPA: xanthine dehydrogenase [bacterium]|nr:MAG: xanthine dehydrogenase [Candidatus Hydrogenedentes bacterium CG1_02_42_14]PIU48449.1 MAG: xanthine dehydrogenase [Candidatus Hydrogenedentes bacterium CG07_land_8_20_14_0_80_42_17]HBW48148.1 xanthine dehydrogenase [bacterium]